MKKCPACAEEIQDEAIKCKRCGELVEEEKKALGFSQSEWRAWFRRMGCLSILLLLALLYCRAPKDDTPRAQRPNPVALTEEDMAIDACKEMLLERYSSRLASRRFPPRRQTSTEKDEDGWEVLFVTSPPRSEFPLLSAGCQGMRTDPQGRWRASVVKIYE